MREQLYACEPNFILGYLERVENATEEELRLAASMFPKRADIGVPDNFSRRTPGASEYDPTDDIYEEDDDEDEARISVEGLLTMAGPSPIDRLFGDNGTSYRTLIAACNRAAASPCKSVIFAINSPGGEVAGCDQTWQAIKALSKSGKECIAENNGMMASAAYWLATACPRIVATSPACEQGSIGVKQVVIDDSGLRDAIGLKKITIVSKNAPRKGEDASNKADLASMQDRCDDMESVFIERVAEGRGVTPQKVIADFGKGAVLISGLAKDAGMIDAIVAPRGIPKAAAPEVPDPYRRIAETTGLAAVADPAAPAATPETGRKIMTLVELLAANPQVQAEYNDRLKLERAGGRAEAFAIGAKVAPILASAAYPQPIKDIGIKAFAGELSIDTFTASVAMYDSLKEQIKQTAAVAETAAAGETPAQKLEADALVIARAGKLGINVEAVQAAAVAQKIEPMKALAAEIELQEQLGKDRAAMGPAGTGA